MFAQRDFQACIEGQLKERGFGEKRKMEILESFEGLRKQFESQGYGSQIAGTMAMNSTFEKLAMATRERAKRTQKTLEVYASNNERIAAGKDVKTSVWVMDGGNGKGAALVRAAISMIQSDPRFPGESVEGLKQGYRGKYYAMIADGLDKYGKGAFGSQRNGAGVNDVVREIFGIDTKNADAKAFAKSYMELDDVMIADRNKAGASLQKLDTYFLPQPTNTHKIVTTPFEKWRDERINDGGRYDWGKMYWPDGSPIRPEQREGVLRDVYTTFSTDGANKVDPKAFGGRGSAIGNSLEDHRFVHYKDADAWIADHEAYGDGTPMDIILQHIESMARKTALVDMFGPNPDTWLNNVKGIILQQAADVVKNGKTKADKGAREMADRVIKNKLEPMFQQYTNKNPMDPNSPMAAGVVATSNILTAAKLGSVPLLAVAGDFHQTLAVRLLNNLPLMDGIGTYLKGITTDFEAAQKLATRSGYVFDNLVGGTYVTERFSPIASYGPAWSRTTSDAMIRASGLSRHTEIARWTAQHELMGVLYDNIKTEYEQLPFQAMMARYGIGKGEWDAARKAIKPYQPDTGANFFRPLDLLDTGLENADDLYKQFFGMVHQESIHMVPGSTLEASVALKGTSRPDTLPGILLHSFAMYKNFPMTVMQMYGRLGMSQAENRLQYFAALGVGMVLVGAMGTQLREIAKGKNPMPMDTAQFWGKAALSGGGMGIWGDFLFNGVNEYGRGPAEMVGGPVIGLLQDSTNLVFGDPFKFVSAWDKQTEFESTFAQRAVTFMKNNTPGTSLWWARLALEREIWDRLDDLADPRIDAKRRQRMRKQERDYGNTYYSEPGSGLFFGR